MKSVYTLQHVNPDGDNTVIAVVPRRGDTGLIKKIIQTEFDNRWCSPPENGADSLVFEKYNDGQQAIRIVREDGYEDMNDGIFILSKTSFFINC